MSLDQVQVAEVRRIIQFESCRSAIFSLASEILDDAVRCVTVSCDVDDDGKLGAAVAYFGPEGVQLGGQLL